MLLSRIAEALEDCARTRSLKAKQEIIRGLFAGCRGDARVIEMLLRVLLPSEDRAHVYGFKTRRMLSLFAGALDAPGLRAWQPSPVAKTDETEQTAVVCYPEYAVAHAMRARRRGHQGAAPPRLQDLLQLCGDLADAYRAQTLEAQGRVLRESALFNAGEDMSFGVWALVARMLLRCVTMGVGVSTVLDALGPRCGAFYARVRDLRKVAAPLPEEEEEGVICGTPFTPMTCEAVRSPYLLKWLFSRQDTLARPLTPVDGRVLVDARGRWYVPLSTRAPENRRYINLEEHRILQQKRRQEHYLMLRLCKRARLLDESRAVGRVVYYTLSIQENGELLMLLRDTAEAIDAGVEVVAGVDEDTIAPAATGPKPTLDALCLRQEARMSGRTLRLATAAQRAPPRRPAPAPLFRAAAVAAAGEENGGRRRSARRRNASRNGEEDDDAVAGGVIVQTKYDGDRLQAHVTEGGEVTLFTRRGVDVTRLYSDIADAIGGRRGWACDVSPCVLDGELIVIDRRTSLPLPWDNEKWRHNHQSADGQRDSPFLRDLHAPDDAVILLEYDDAELACAWEDNAYHDISFAPLGSLRRGGYPASDDNDDFPRRARRASEHTMLQFVVFDVLMWRGESTMLRPYAERYRLLRTAAAPRQAPQHVIVIPDGNRRVSTAAELVEIVREAVRLGREGCVLKDPAASYQCKRSRCVQKVKPRGPDINACVVGLGFSLSANPRRWGLLTGVRRGEDEELSHIVTYCRTEVLEGDQPHRAFQHVYDDMRSRLCVKGLVRAMQQSERAILPCRDKNHEAVVARAAGGGYRVEWRATRQAAVSPCVLMVLPGVLDNDVQWLVNPFEMRYALSLRGDLRPLNGAGGMRVPRHPVGRVEFDPRCDDWDSVESAARKFEEAMELSTCIETWTLRYVAALRALPPTKARMEELGQILSAWETLHDRWPMPPPAKVASYDDMDTALERTKRRLLTTLRAPPLVTKALRALSNEERAALASLPPRSQWAAFNAARTLVDEASAFDRYAAVTDEHRQRHAVLERMIRRPIVRCASALSCATSSSDAETTSEEGSDDRAAYCYYSFFDEDMGDVSS